MRPLEELDAGDRLPPLTPFSAEHNTISGLHRNWQAIERRGDLDAARWIGNRLSGAGFEVRRSDFRVPMFDTAIAELRVGEKRIEVAPQPIVVPTGSRRKRRCPISLSAIAAG